MNIAENLESGRYSLGNPTDILDEYTFLPLRGVIFHHGVVVPNLTANGGSISVVHGRLTETRQGAVKELQRVFNLDKQRAEKALDEKKAIIVEFEPGDEYTNAIRTGPDGSTLFIHGVNDGLIHGE